MSCSVGDSDPLQSHRVSASFRFLLVLLDAEQQDIDGVESFLNMWDAVEDGERLPHVFTEQQLQAQNHQVQFWQEAVTSEQTLLAATGGNIINLLVYIHSATKLHKIKVTQLILSLTRAEKIWQLIEEQTDIRLFCNNSRN